MRTRIYRCHASIALLIFAIVSPALCAEPQVASEIDARNFYVGDGFVWSLTVTGARQADAPNIPPLPDFFMHPEEPQVLEQGEARTFIYRFRLIPRRPGLLTLPSVSVQADQQALATEPRVLNVGEPQNTSDLRLELSFDRSEVFVGQPVTLTVRWYTALPLPGIKALDVNLPILNDPDFDVIVPEAERGAGGKPGTIGLPVEGQRVIGGLGEIKINDQDFNVITFRRIVVPLKPGNYQVSHCRLLCSYVRPSGGAVQSSPRYPSYFDNDFFQETAGRESYVRYGTRAEPIALHVLPLPDTNRPAEFSGIVGSGEITAEADPQTLTIGDPVTLTVRLRGFAVPEALKLPDLKRLADFSDQFQVPEAQSPPRVQDGEAIYVQSIRPVRTAVTTVPALKVVVFDPDKRRYETLETKPLPLRVLPDGGITSIDLGTNAPARLELNPTGIWHNLPADALDPLTRAGLLIKWSAPGWVVLPPILLFVLSGPARLRRMKRADPQRWRQVTAFPKARRALGHATTFQQQQAAVEDYLAARLDIRTCALTYHQVQRAMRACGIEPEDATLNFLRELFFDADRAQFGREGTTATAKLDRAMLLRELQALERRFER